MPVRDQTFKVLGIDVGRNYIAWAVLRGSVNSGFSLYRHGLLTTQDLGETEVFGTSLGHWHHFFEWFVLKDIRPTAWAVERFTYRPGSQGSSSEDINLQIPAMTGPGAFLVRNTEWKTYFHSNVLSKEEGGTHRFFGTPTSHEADACGIALYLGAVLLPRCVEVRLKTQHVLQASQRGMPQGSLFQPNVL